MRYLQSVEFRDDYEGVLVFGTLIERDDAELAELIVEKNHLVLSAIESPLFPDFYKYEANCEDGVLAVLTKALANGKYEDFFNEIDDGYLSAECNLGEEEAHSIASWMSGKNILCVIGKDVQKDKLTNWFKLLTKLATVSFLQVGSEQSCGQNDFEFPEIPEELQSLDGTITYTCRALDLAQSVELIGSAQFSVAAKIKDGDKVVIKNSDSHRCEYTKSYS